MKKRKDIYLFKIFFSIWHRQFKTFSLRRKSSTQSINKTSESPPTLRKAFNSKSEDELKYVRHFRGSDIPTRSNNSFNRAETQSCSLQNINEFNFLDRNSRNRKTFQNCETTNKSQSYLGSNSPDLRQRGYQSTTNSQLSLISTNPFEDDLEIHLTKKANTDKLPRKKRRAPQPPVSILKKINTHEEFLQRYTPFISFIKV